MQASYPSQNIIVLDHLGPLRPTRPLSNHRSSIEDLYISGAATNPTVDIAGTPARLAAMTFSKTGTKIDPSKAAPNLCN
jgi:phytoene dehydrogenase-like protein